MAFVARRNRAGAAAASAISRRRLEIFFQQFPNTDGNPGVADLHYTLTVTPVGGAAPVVRNRVTKNSGRVRFRLGAGETAKLDILGSSYTVRRRDVAFHPIAELRGVQQRLNALGYNAGTIHANNQLANVLTNQTEVTERAILSFQSDEGLFPDALWGPKSERKLRNRMHRERGE